MLRHQDALPVKILGISFSPLPLEAILTHVSLALHQGSGGMIVTPNLDIVGKSRRDTNVTELIEKADIVTMDGWPVALAGRLGGNWGTRVTGADLAVALTERAAQAGWKVFLLGGDPGVATRAAKRLRDKSASIKIVGTYCPPFGFEADDEEVAAISDVVAGAKPDLVLVGLGFPKQERLSYLLAEGLPGTWFLNCGQALGFIAGSQRRAPLLIQRLGLEWLFRLANEPRRLWRRYLIDGPPTMVALLLDAVRRRFS